LLLALLLPGQADCGSQAVVYGNEAGHTGVVSLLLRIGPVAALLAGVVAAAGCSSPSGCPPGAPCPMAMPRVTFTPTINGQLAVLPKDGSPPRYHVRPGEHLVMKVAVTVPGHLTVTALWFGISTGILGGGPDGTGSMHPILASYRQPLSAGSHTFGLRWRVPERRSGTSLYLITAWSGHSPPGNAEQFVAQLILS
jgi:hypothetical protein